MKYPKLRELKEAFTALVKGPYTTKFPKAPSPAAPAYRGKPEFDLEECVVCGACANVCPAEVIETIETTPQGKAATQSETESQLPPPGFRKLILHYDKCIFCGQCEVHCLTEKGVHLTQKYDLATLDRKECIETVEDKLIFCEHCGEAITTQKHLRWLIERLGPQVFSNPNLFLTSYEEIKLIKKGLPREKGLPLGRFDHLRILCPRCRKRLTLKEEWGY